ncbi:VOC family protein [Roseomonas marmotae]|uniref:VOC family protein n=1 Tax=Roseomonas marmotae TaxID=2768161 RepID=A0ABS3KH03_9PROT|nr:VOC family protein [Roseomonas marmotae]QTI80911.1 VOC family protein [Roseomonas marmotae]
MPPPRFDHVVVYVEDQLDASAEAYQRLGFQLTERGHHTLGSSNHLAIFGTDYLELLGYEPARITKDSVLWNMPKGLGGLVFKPGADAGFRDAIVERGVPAEESREFSRPVDLPEGTRDAKFRVTHLKPEVSFNGRVFFCHHFTPELVWRPEWQRHANGTTGIAEFIVASAEPERAAEPYRKLFGDAPFETVDGGVALRTDKGRLLILTPEAARAHLGDALPPLPADGRDAMVGLILRTASLTQAKAALAAGGVPAREEAGRLLVAAPDAFGLALGFVE